jgi:hypothetical protein
MRKLILSIGTGESSTCQMFEQGAAQQRVPADAASLRYAARLNAPLAACIKDEVRTRFMSSDRVVTTADQG